MPTSTPDRVSDFTSDAGRRRALRAYDQAVARLWPVPVESVQLETSFGTVHALRHGPAGDDPVVLIAGAGGNAVSWYRHVEQLGRCRPVLALDPLGDGGRSVQTVPITDAADVARWLDEVLAAVGAARAHLVGSSFGGWAAVAQQLTGGGRVSAVTLLDPAGLAPLSGRFYRWVVLGGTAALLPGGLRRIAARRLVNGTLLDGDLLRLGLAARSFRRRLPSPPVLTGAELAAVPTPVQLLLGAHSALHDSAAVAARVAAAAPGWRVEVVPGTGHALPLEAVDLVVDRVLGFAPTRG